MAKKNDLAALAALGALGFMLKNKSDSDFQKNREDQTSKYRPTEDSNPTRGAGYNSTETRNAPVMELKTPAQSIDAADVSSDANSMVSSGPSGTTITGPAAPPDLNIQPPVISKAVNPAAKVQSNNLPKAIARNRSPGDEMSAYAKNLPDVRTNFGSLVNPYPADNKAAAKANARQAAIEATNRHNEDQKALMDERRRNQKGQQDLGYGQTLKRGGAVKKMASGGMTSSASRRGDGIATKGKTRGKIC